MYFIKFLKGVGVEKTKGKVNPEAPPFRQSFQTLTAKLKLQIYYKHPTYPYSPFSKSINLSTHLSTFLVPNLFPPESPLPTDYPSPLSTYRTPQTNPKYETVYNKTSFQHPKIPPNHPNPQAFPTQNLPYYKTTP